MFPPVNDTRRTKPKFEVETLLAFVVDIDIDINIDVGSARPFVNATVSGFPSTSPPPFPNLFNETMYDL